MKLGEMRAALQDSIRADEKAVEDKVLEYENQTDEELLAKFKQGYDLTPEGVRPHFLSMVKSTLTPIEHMVDAWEREWVPRYNTQIDRIFRLLEEAGF